MASNSGFDIQYFHTGIERGLRVYFYSKPGDPNHKTTVELDLSMYFQKGQISRVGSVQLFNQYATIGLQDDVTRIMRYASASAQACFPINSLTPKYTITRYDNLATPTSFELIFFESVQPAYNILAVLP